MVDLSGASFYGAPTSGGGQFPTAALDDPVAQSVEHVTFNHVAVGSNPTRITNQFKALAFLKGSLRRPLLRSGEHFGARSRALARDGVPQPQAKGPGAP